MDWYRAEALIALTALTLATMTSAAAQSASEEPATRIVRFRIDYPKADLAQIDKLQNWQAIMRKSVLASLKFVNKHWDICAEAERFDKSSNDCGKLQVTGETLGDVHYRLNATFIANRDPIKNMKVNATSTVLGVIQIGLKGGIFQYTNAMKALGRPHNELSFEEGYFCYPGYELVDSDTCRRTRHLRRHRALQPIEARLPDNGV